jgi:hypothetical protein
MDEQIHFCDAQTNDDNPLSRCWESAVIRYRQIRNLDMSLIDPEPKWWGYRCQIHVTWLQAKYLKIERLS